MQRAINILEAIMLSTKEIIDNLKSLPVEDRALIADALLQSLNQPEDDITKAWIKEANKRLEEIRKGKVDTIPAHVVFQEIQEKYSK